MCASKRAFVCLQMNWVYSLCALSVPDKGIFVAACGSGGMRVAFVGMFEGKLKVSQVPARLWVFLITPRCSQNTQSRLMRA